MMLKKVPFGATGLSVSPIGFGGAPIGFLQSDRQNVANLLSFLLDNGVNVIDTAPMYETSEEVIGQVIGHRRPEFVLISKCGTKLDDVHEPVWSPALITKTIDRSLRRLKTDALDVMLLHTCDLATLKQGDALAALVKAQHAGKVSHIGYSGDNEAAAYAATLPDIDVIQTSISIADQANIELVLPAARARNIAIIAKRPVANAAWKAPDQQPGMYQGYAQEYHNRLKKMNLSPADLGFTASPQDAWPELALRFTLSQPGVHTAIIGTTNPANAPKNIAAAAKGPLPKEVVEKIRAAFVKARANNSWPGQG
jgi:aryl-alcohol dehydrogenase-like predicted oxidoreductase